MLVKIAWKNIWRNPVRSLVLIVAIGLGIWALSFLLGLTHGIINSYVASAIDNRTSHLQIHHPDYTEEKEIADFFDASAVENFLDTAGFVAEYSPRVIAEGMISSPRASRAVRLYGIDEIKEDRVTGLKNKLADSSASLDAYNPAIFLSSSEAEKLGVKVRSKVVINFQNIDGEVTAAAFRVAGLLRNKGGKMDEIIAFTGLKELQRLAEMQPEEYHEIAILTRDIDHTPDYIRATKEQFPELAVQDYKELAPDLALMDAHIRFSTSVMIVIFMLALVFGIINTMLMAVLERYKEIGMLIAIGMKKTEVFSMVVLETIFISLAGVPFGLFCGGVTIYLTRLKGIDLEKWSDTLNEFGIMPVIYPETDLSTFFIIAVAVLITAVLASVYPAGKATSLDPVEALHKI